MSQIAQRWASICVLAMMLCVQAQAQPVCAPAESFQRFVVRFKSDAPFRLTRIRFPLPLTAHEAEAPPRHELLSRAQYQSRAPLGMVTPAREKELRGTEGQLCETLQVTQGRAILTHASCDTDVYGNQFRFVRQAGCWRLVDVRLSGM